MSLQMQGHGLRFADFNQVKFTIQLGPFWTQEEADLEELLWKLRKTVSIWSCTKCNHWEYQEIMSKWALGSVPQWSCFAISKISDLFLLQTQGWGNSLCTKYFSSDLLGSCTNTGQWLHSLSRKVALTQGGLQLYLGLSLVTAKKLKYADKITCSPLLPWGWQSHFPTVLWLLCTMGLPYPLSSFFSSIPISFLLHMQH